MEGKKIFVKTYGCQMNVHETDKIYSDFIAVGCEVATSIKQADIIIYNTCCIRESAETKLLGNLGIAKKLKENNRDIIVVVCGCMSQQDGMAEYLHKRCPFINIITGTYKLSNLVEMVTNVHLGYNVDIEVDYARKEKLSSLYHSGGVNHYVNIMYGCDNFCTYCIVPYVKGRERSRDLQDVKVEVEALINGGTKEITLLGQNVNSYSDANGNKFYDLLKSLSEIEGDFWIKFMTPHPKDLSGDVIKLIGSSSKLASYVHLPLQSGSDGILSKMNRKYDLKTYLSKVEMIKKYIPSYGITSDIIIGFPGESEEDFLATLETTKNVRYNNLFMFLYSKRTGTPACEMDNQVDIKVKKERLNRLMAQQSQIENELAMESVGKTFKVLCDKDGEFCTGKTESDKPIVIEGNHEGIYNTFIYVTITKTINSKLYGIIKE